MYKGTYITVHQIHAVVQCKLVNRALKTSKTEFQWPLYGLQMDVSRCTRWHWSFVIGVCNSVLWENGLIFSFCPFITEFSLDLFSELCLSYLHKRLSDDIPTSNLGAFALVPAGQGTDKCFGVHAYGIPPAFPVWIILASNSWTAADQNPAA